MPADLAPPIQHYFDADREPAGRLGACFTADAVVRDEARTHVGPDAIDAWHAATKASTPYNVEPIDTVDNAGRTTVTARVSGSFPNSPVTLCFAFTMRGNLIAALDIA